VAFGSLLSLQGTSAPALQTAAAEQTAQAQQNAQVQQIAETLPVTVPVTA
jgi:hypothetical protein